MRRLIISLILALPALAMAQQDEPFSPPSGLHPHSGTTGHEMPGDGDLPDQTSSKAAFSGSKDLL